jgi:hypothetical protein
MIISRLIGDKGAEYDRPILSDTLVTHRMYGSGARRPQQYSSAI